VLGGHSVDDRDEVRLRGDRTSIRKRVITNTGAKPETFWLTKPIGTGVISTGVKFQKRAKNP
jgi:hypothetical protein